MHDYDILFMQEAISVALENLDKGTGGPFGAVVVKEGKIIARCGNSVTSTNDPTAHAEVNAIREACRVLNSFQLEECTIYSSCEPCPMCLGAIYWARPRLFILLLGVKMQLLLDSMTPIFTTNLRYPHSIEPWLLSRYFNKKG